MSHANPNDPITEALSTCLVVFGPQGCGKTSNAELLRATFGKDRVYDEWTFHDPGRAPKPNSLILTIDRNEAPGFINVISYQTAMAAVPEPENVPVARDEDGGWLHPAIPWHLVPDDHDATPLLERMGYESAVRSMEHDAPEDVRDRYIDRGEPDFSEWHPTPPSGQTGWFLGAVYDTEEGPKAAWLRRSKEAGR